MRKIRTERASFTRKQWSRWVQPVMDHYLMACCDCGLVHEMQFRAREVLRENSRGKVTAALPKSKAIVWFRARRAEAYTRRERKKK